MSFHAAMGYLAGFFFILAFIPYFTQTLNGQVRPNRATWLIWTILGVLIFASYKSVGAENTIWVAIAGAIGPFAILILAFWRGEGGISKLDIACLASAFMGLVGWYFTANAFVGLVLFLVVDGMGAIPTVIKTWRNPKSESLPGWTLWLTGSTFQLFALEKWDIELSLYPIYFFVGQIIVIGLALRRYSRFRFS